MSNSSIDSGQVLLPNYNTKRKVLVADDDPEILEALTLILEDADYEVETTVNGKTVREVKETLPDLILLDIWMSGMDGREICTYLKSQDLTRHIPIIMISANKDAAHISKEARADDFVAKPFEIDELLSRVKKYLNNEH